MWERQSCFKMGIIECTFAFSMQGQMAQAALAWTSGLGFFSNDQRRRTPSRRSMILKEKDNSLANLTPKLQASPQLQHSVQCKLMTCFPQHVFPRVQFGSCSRLSLLVWWWKHSSSRSESCSAWLSHHIPPAQSLTPIPLLTFQQLH